MKIALIGYGKMGKAIEKIAVDRGHSVVCKIDINENGTYDSPEFAQADVVIEFSQPQAAYDNYLKCFEHNKAVVSGTTGWLDKMADIKSRCEGGKQTFFYASNYSIGMNIFFEINKKLAKLMNPYSNFDVEMSEVHHIHKLDAPSGTAITLANGISENLDRKSAGWTLAPEEEANKVKITAYREGEVPGIHTVKYTSAEESLEMTHEAFSREALALGAVLAAEFTCGKKGFLGMNDMLGF